LFKRKAYVILLTQISVPFQFRSLGIPWELRLLQY
jgi:hypothetical protein